MTTLILKDLSVTTELDARELSAVRGGSRGLYGDMGNFGPVYTPTYGQNEFNFNAVQSLSQCQNTEVNIGNNAAFVCGITSNVTPTQNGNNSINFGR